MRRSEQRILTTHVGSLPRGEGLADLIVAREEGGALDAATFEAAVRAAIERVISRQGECGIDIANDGEMERASFVSYIASRMRGFGPGGEQARPLPLDAQSFPIWFENLGRSGRRRLNPYAFPQAIGEVSYDDLSGVTRECDDFKAGLAGRDDDFVETFMTSVSPGFAATAMMNRHYDSHEAYVRALARGLGREYRHIVEQGFVLQIDSPDLAMERAGYFQAETLAAFRAQIEMHIDALNEALEGIPADRVRLHACWGNRDGPHLHDVAVGDVIDIMYQAEVGAISLPFANPRHAHEIEVLREQPLPDEMLLISGVIETTNNYVEHPMVVAERIERAARALGDPARLVAGTDCGFATLAGDTFTAEDVVWAKLEALCEGARIASHRLFG